MSVYKFVYDWIEMFGIEWFLGKTLAETKAELESSSALIRITENGHYVMHGEDEDSEYEIDGTIEDIYTEIQDQIENYKKTGNIQ